MRALRYKMETSVMLGFVYFLASVAGAQHNNNNNNNDNKNDNTDVWTQKIESFHVISEIQYRFATTQIVSLVRNTAKEGQEITFDVTLPKEAFIMHFSMVIDGHVYEGEVKEKQEAKRQYQAAVDRGESSGHVGQRARHANLFDVSVHIASGSVVNFTLTYQELLRRTLGLYQHEIHVSPGQPVEDFQVQVHIKDKTPITMIKTPSVRTDYLISHNADVVPTESVSVTQTSPTTAYIQYSPSLSDQGDDGFTARFLVQYDVEHGKTGDLLVIGGYFVHFFAPELPLMPKDIIFVLDKSGSMSGRKIEQLKEAMGVVLNDLSKEDRFNIINFSDHAYKWSDSLKDASTQIKQIAIGFVKGIGASGGTNINDALVTAVRELQKREDKSRVPIIFFLTDGDATTGVTTVSQITSNVMSANEGVVSIFSLALGQSADYNMLKTIGAQNSGFARKIYEASDSALQVTTLYSEIAAVVMKNLKIEYLNSSVDEFFTTQTEFPVVFNGTEVVICGLLNDKMRTFEYDIKGVQKSGDVDLNFETDSVEAFSVGSDEYIENEVQDLMNSPRDLGGIVEKMWAFLSIKQLLKERDKGDDKQMETLKRKIINMAVKYKFVTPLTSMVVSKPERDGQKVETVQSSLKDVDEQLALPGGVNFAYSSKLMQPRHHQYRVQRPMGAMLDLSGGHTTGNILSAMSPMRAYTPSTTFSVPTSAKRKFKKSKLRRWQRKRKTSAKRKFKKWKNRNVSREQKTTKKTIPVLSRIVVDTPTNTMCVVPKRWLPGNYSLLAKPSRLTSMKKPPLLVELTSGKGRHALLNSISLSDGTRVTFNNPGSELWRHRAGSWTTVKDANRGTTLYLSQISGTRVVEVHLMRKQGRKRLYSLVIFDVLGDGGKRFSKVSRPSNQKKGVRKLCGVGNETFDKIGVVPRRKAMRFAMN